MAIVKQLKLTGSNQEHSKNEYFESPDMCLQIFLPSQNGKGMTLLSYEHPPSNLTPLVKLLKICKLNYCSITARQVAAKGKIVRPFEFRACDNGIKWG